MWMACADMARQPNARQACRHLTDDLTRILGVPTLLYRREVSPWRPIGSSAEAGAGAEAGSRPTSAQLDDVVSFLVPAAARTLGTAWTPIPLDEELPSQVLLLLPGDWRSGRPATWLARFAITASASLRLAVSRQSVRATETIGEKMQALARAAGRATSDRALHQLVLNAAATTVDARLGSLAVYQEKDEAIVIAATHGYASDAVAQVRIVPGSGIIGGVFTSRKPLLVRDTRRVPGLPARRGRYETPSFMALPVLSNEGALGVMTFADRRDGRAFTRRDLAAARAVSTVASVVLVRQQLAKLTDELSHAAAVDSLTGMFNRRYMETRLVSELERSRRTGVPVALMMLDIDTFKGINDRFGHQAGDAVLRKVSDIIRRSVRVSDVCTRYGGDEFSIIVAEHAPSAPHTAERIRQRVEAHGWDTLGIPPSLTVTLSIGIATSQPGEAPDSLIGRADRHLYQAKALGRNRVYPDNGHTTSS